jgi:hypothetical protein
MSSKRQGLPVRTVCVMASIALSACAPVSLTALSVGTAAGVQHHLSAITYRTFTTPLPKVRSAVNVALHRMAIKVDSREPMKTGERILARAAKRDIEIELESLSPKTTRMRSTARNGILMDAATASEIILQTEKVLRGV